MKQQILKWPKVLGILANKHSNVILTIGTIFGISAVVYTTSKATLKIKEDIDNLEFDAEEEGRIVSKKEKAKIIFRDGWPVAIAVVSTGTMTVCNGIKNGRRIRMATAGYEFYKDYLYSYRDKVKEKWGDKEERKINAERVTNAHDISQINPELVPSVGYGNVLFIEGVSGQVFRSSVDHIRQCEKRFNQELKGSDWMCFNDWLREVGLRTMSENVGDYLGFSERFEHDGLNITFTPSNEVFGTGETATIITYDDPLCTEGDYRVIDW